MVFELLVKIPKEDPSFGSSLSEVFYWSARYLKYCLEHPCPPNQLFFPPKKAWQKFQPLEHPSNYTKQSRKHTKQSNEIFKNDGPYVVYEEDET